jgi:hypothetical protein
MPANNGLWLHEDRRLLPPTPKPAQHPPEEFVRNGSAQLRMPPFQDSKLLPERQIFWEQVAARAKE